MPTKEQIAADDDSIPEFSTLFTNTRVRDIARVEAYRLVMNQRGEQQEVMLARRFGGATDAVDVGDAGGGGSYNLIARRRNGQIVARTTITIDGPPRAAEDADPGDDDDEDEDAERERQRRRDADVESLRRPDPIDSAIKILAAINGSAGGSRQQTSEVERVLRQENDAMRQRMDDMRRALIDELDGMRKRHADEIDSKKREIERLEEKNRGLHNQLAEFQAIIAKAQGGSGEDPLKGAIANIAPILVQFMVDKNKSGGGGAPNNGPLPPSMNIK